MEQAESSVNHHSMCKHLHAQHGLTGRVLDVQTTWMMQFMQRKLHVPIQTRVTYGTSRSDFMYTCCTTPVTVKLTVDLQAIKHAYWQLDTDPAQLWSCYRYQLHSVALHACNPMCLLRVNRHFSTGLASL